MDQNIYKRNELLAQKVIKGLQSRNMSGYYAADKAEALQKALDLIAAHIDELNARIESRGYSCTSEISKREEMSNIMQEIVDDNKSVVPVSISNFDARA